MLELAAGGRDPSPGAGRARWPSWHGADEVFCTGTMGEIAGVTEIDGRAIADGAVGPLTHRISELFAAHARGSGTQVV